MSDKNKLAQAKQLLDAAFASIQHAQSILGELTGDASVPSTSGDHAQKAQVAGSVSTSGEGARIIEGIFDGQNMVGPDGKQYSIPANYASKSKLVEGDLMKLTIDSSGSFIYKQIGPVDRDRKTGVLTQDPETDEFVVLVEGKPYKVLLASVTYFKGEPGDEVVILTPTGKESEWAAVENIIKVLPGGAQSPAPAPQAGGPTPVIHDRTGEGSSEGGDESPAESEVPAEEVASETPEPPAASGLGSAEPASTESAPAEESNPEPAGKAQDMFAKTDPVASEPEESRDPAAPMKEENLDLPTQVVPGGLTPASGLSDTRHDPAHLPSSDSGPGTPVTPEAPSMPSQAGQDYNQSTLSNTADIAGQKSGEAPPEQDEFERI